MFSKRLQELTAGDIEAVVASQLLEDGEIEFKETLPSKTGSDPWFKDQKEIGDRARNEVLAEVIAFANAFGGTMILGVAETDDKPARAKAVVPLPKCVDLADRLRLQCRDCIEPQIPMLEVVGVPTQSDGAGVVVFRTARSRMAPHRHTVTRECHVRRADRTERMTMREIQDLTLQVERGLAGVDAEFAGSSRRFSERFAAFKRHNLGFGVRVCGVPVVALSIDNLQKNPAAQIPLRRFTAVMGQENAEVSIPEQYIQWRPTLRGIDGRGGGEQNAHVSVELHGRTTGIVDCWLLVRQQDESEQRGQTLYPSWVMGLVANTLCGVERYRRLAGTVEVEYGLELEIITSQSVRVGRYGRSDYVDYLGPFPAGQTMFPRYSVGDSQEFTQLASLVERDFWNACGHAWDTGLAIDFQPALAELAR